VISEEIRGPNSGDFLWPSAGISVAAVVEFPWPPTSVHPHPIAEPGNKVAFSVALKIPGRLLASTRLGGTNRC
jgi:hypothetical protein